MSNKRPDQPGARPTIQGIIKGHRIGYGGFTLIEVIVVVAVLGILTGTVLLAVGNQGTQSAVTACKANAKSLETAIDEYRSDSNGAYPTGPTTTDPSDTAWKMLLQPVPNFANSPFMRDPIPTVDYVLWWELDSSGRPHVYVDSGVTTSSFLYPTGNNIQSNMDFIATGGSACDTYAH